MKTIIENFIFKWHFLFWDCIFLIRNFKILNTIKVSKITIFYIEIVNTRIAMKKQRRILMENNMAMEYTIFCYQCEQTVGE